jgi:hypothetical protein
MLRHDMLLQAWRRIAHRAGVSTAGEQWIASGLLPQANAKTAVTSSPSSLVASLWLTSPSFTLQPQRAASKINSMATDLGKDELENGSEPGAIAVPSARTPAHEIAFLVTSFVLTLCVLGMNVYGFSRLLVQLKKAGVRVRESVNVRGAVKSGQSTPRYGECTTSECSKPA